MIEIKDIDNAVNKLIENNVIDDFFSKEAKTVLTWLKYGRKEAEKVSKKAVKNLEKNGFVSSDGKKLLVEKDGIWFLLAVLGAKGYIRQIEV